MSLHEPSVRPTEEGESTAASRVPPHPVLTRHYADERERRAHVDRLFDASARHYDWITSIMSFGTGARYRERALRRAGLAAGMHVLDVGSGTGVIAGRAARIAGPRGSVTALDPSLGMLREAGRRWGGPRVQALGEHLPFAGSRFDLLCMGYALRHVADLEVAFCEYLRVLRPGGALLLLEITLPASRLPHALLKTYFKVLLPGLTHICRGSRDARALVAYYWDTIEQCVPPETILDALRRAGFGRVERRVELGIFSEYTARKS